MLWCRIAIIDTIIRDIDNGVDRRGRGEPDGRGQPRQVSGCCWSAPIRGQVPGHNLALYLVQEARRDQRFDGDHIGERRNL